MTFGDAMRAGDITVTVPRAKLLLLPAGPAVHRRAMTGGGPGVAVVATPDKFAKVTKVDRVGVTGVAVAVGAAMVLVSLPMHGSSSLPSLLALFGTPVGILAVDNEFLAELVVPPITGTPTPVWHACRPRVSPTITSILPGGTVGNVVAVRLGGLPTGV